MGNVAPSRNSARTRSGGTPSAERRIVLLGHFAVCVDGVEVRLPPAAPRLVALVALQHAPMTRSQLAELLWPHLEGPVGFASLRSTLSRLRSSHPDLLASGPGDIAIANDVTVDIWEHEALAARVTGDPEVATHEAFAEQPLLELLPAWRDEWVMFERDRLREIRMHAIEAQALALAEARCFARAISAIYAAVRLDPLRESALRALIEIHLAEGNRAQAARCYLAFRERLKRALQIEPSDEMRLLVAPLLPVQS